MSVEHTPTPWVVVPSTKDHGPYVTAEYGGDICDCYAMSNYLAASMRNGGTSFPIHHQGDAADANAAFIVRCVNSHDDLVAALQAAGSYVPEEAKSTLAQVEAALAKAEGLS